MEDGTSGLSGVSKARDLGSEHVGAGALYAGGAGIVEIAGVEAEASLVAVGPFEVVDQGPVEVSAHVETGADGATNRRQAPPNEIRPPSVGRVGDAILGDHEREPEPGAFGERALESFGKDLPSQIVHGRSRLRAPRILSGQRHEPPRVVVHAEEI